MVDDNRVQHIGQELHVTISAGFAAYPDKDFNEDKELIEIADKALYIAKESGRNRVHGVS